MPITKKSEARESEAPVLDIPIAHVKIVEAELRDEPEEITTNSGETFTADPNLNCMIEVVDDMQEGKFDGTRFYDSFKLKQDPDGDWTIRDGTKLAALAKAYYGNDFFETDTVFNEDDLGGFVFQAKVEPKTNFRTKAIIGSTLNYETIVRIPVSKQEREKLAQEQREKAASAKQEAEAANEEDFGEIPF